MWLVEQAAPPAAPGLRGFLDFARSDAGSANAHTLGSAIDQGVDRLQIQIPAAFTYIMGVADSVPKLRAAAAHFANSCHITKSP
jgi:hypothetical protein